MGKSYFDTRFVKDGWIRAEWGDFILLIYLHPPGAVDSHGHSDQGSMNLYFRGEPLLIDIGRISYLPQKENLVSVSALGHNVPSIDTLGSKAIKRSFYTRDFLDSSEVDVQELDASSHIKIRFKGFSRLLPDMEFLRCYKVFDKGLQITDRFEGNAESFQLTTPFHFLGVSCELDRQVARIRSKNKELFQWTIHSNSPETKTELHWGSWDQHWGWRAARYGLRQRCASVVTNQRVQAPIENTFQIESI